MIEWVILHVLSATLVASLLATGAVCIGRYWDRPQLAHVLWVAVILKLIVPAWVSFRVPLVDSFAWLQSTATWTSAWGAALVSSVLWVWLLGSLWVLCSRWVTTHRLSTWLGSVSEDRVATWRASQLAESIGHRSPPVCLVPSSVSPMVVGAGQRARIVIPDTLWRNSSPDQRDALLWHELEHHLRGDTWVRWVQWCVGIAFWWHPLFWVACEQIHRHEERCCDRAAAKRVHGGRRVYAETLLHALDYLGQGQTSRRQVSIVSEKTEFLTSATRLLRWPTNWLRDKTRQSRREISELESRLVAVMGGANATANAPLVQMVSLAVIVGAMPLGLSITSIPTRAFVKNEAMNQTIVQLASPEAELVSRFDSESLKADETIPAPNDSKFETATPSLVEQIAAPASLPPSPSGWWSDQSPNDFVVVPLGKSDEATTASIVLRDDGEIWVETDNQHWDMTSHQWTAVVSLDDGSSQTPAGSASLMLADAKLIGRGRQIVTGDKAGRIRLWDVDSGEPVSLIGQHRSEITSLAYDPTGGLIAADAGGTLIRWGLASGEPKAVWHGPEGALTTVRFASDHSTNNKTQIDPPQLWVICGDWQTAQPTTSLIQLDAEELSVLRSIEMPGNYASLTAATDGLLLVDWSGRVDHLTQTMLNVGVQANSVDTTFQLVPPASPSPTPMMVSVVGWIEKATVSATRFSQHSPLGAMASIRPNETTTSHE